MSASWIEVINRGLSIDEVYRADLDRADIEKVYAFCHEWVFDFQPRNRIGKHRDKVLQRAAEAEVNLRLFLLANLYAWKLTTVGNRPFPTGTLGLEAAVKCVRAYSAACRERFGTFDVSSLNQLLGERDSLGWVEDKLFRSEVIAGSWIVNYKIFNSGDLPQKLYTEHELALNPYWLAVEETYWNTVYHDYINRPPDPSLPPVLLRHRFDVAQVLGKLKTRPREGLHIFIAREQVMPRAVREVLSLRGLEPGDFQIDGTKPVHNAFKFWARLAAAIQQYECLNFVDKLPSKFDALKIGSGP